MRNPYLFSFCGLIWGSFPSLLQLSVLQTQPGSWKSFYSSLAIKVQHIKLSPHLLLCHLIKRLLQENLWEMIYPADKAEPRHSQGALKIKNVAQMGLFCTVLSYSSPSPPKLFLIFFPLCCSVTFLFSLIPYLSLSQSRTGTNKCLVWSDLKNEPSMSCFLDVDLFGVFLRRSFVRAGREAEAAALPWAVNQGLCAAQMGSLQCSGAPGTTLPRTGLESDFSEQCWSPRAWSGLHWCSCASCSKQMWLKSCRNVMSCRFLQKGEGAGAVSQRCVPDWGAASDWAHWALCITGALCLSEIEIGTCVQLAGDVLALWKRSWVEIRSLVFPGHRGIKAPELLLGCGFRKPL